MFDNFLANTTMYKNFSRFAQSFGNNPTTQNSKQCKIYYSWYLRYIMLTCSLVMLTKANNCRGCWLGLGNRNRSSGQLSASYSCCILGMIYHSDRYLVLRKSWSMKKIHSFDFQRSPILMIVFYWFLAGIVPSIISCIFLRILASKKLLQAFLFPFLIMFKEKKKMTFKRNDSIEKSLEVMITIGL